MGGIICLNIYYLSKHWNRYITITCKTKFAVLFSYFGIYKHNATENWGKMGKIAKLVTECQKSRYASILPHHRCAPISSLPSCKYHWFCCFSTHSAIPSFAFLTFFFLLYPFSGAHQQKRTIHTSECIRRHFSEIITDNLTYVFEKNGHTHVPHSFAQTLGDSGRIIYEVNIKFLLIEAKQHLVQNNRRILLPYL